MVSGHDPFEPLHSALRRVAEELDRRWPHPFPPKKTPPATASHRGRHGLDRNGPLKGLLGGIFQKKAAAGAAGATGEDTSCANCLHFAVTWSFLVNGFLQAIPCQIKSIKKRFHKQHDDNRRSTCSGPPFPPKKVESLRRNDKKNELLPVELLLTFVFDHLLRSFPKLDGKNVGSESKLAAKDAQFDHFGTITGFCNGRKADVDGFLTNLGFARMGGVPSSMVEVAAAEKADDGRGGATVEVGEKHETNVGHKLANGLLQIPLSNVERLKSTLTTVSLSELIDLVPQLGRSSTKEYPDKKKLFSVQDFFRYTETEGRRFFEELDRDGDGLVTLEDLEIAMTKRKLPRRYARDFLRHTRGHIFSKSIGWKQFLTLMEQKEPTILRAYTTLCLSKSGTLQKSQILTSLKSAGLPANDDNAIAMIRCLNADAEGSISYSHFRNFMLLLPSERLSDDPRNIWFEAATVVAVAPPVELPAGNVIKAALAGGLSCALSCSIMHPVDTMKTRVQASTLSFPEVVSKLPEIGLQGLYRGSIPAILGQFSSHGLRTGIFEASKLVLINVAPNLPEIQVQSLSSFTSTVLGTAVRIPCEVLKQRLQAGIFDNVGEAIVGTLRQDGFRGFFRGTGATLCREVPFYVAGMGLYAESKKAAQKLLKRDLEPWETIVVGALSGGLAAVVTTPFDVMKTRMMTAPQGLPVSMSMVAFNILRHEGPLGLFKGAVPRFFWIAPLGAMNFAGYELAKKAMTENENGNRDHLAQKRVATSG